MTQRPIGSALDGAWGEPLDVACPLCGVSPGHPCRNTKNARKPSSVIHARRVFAANDLATEQLAAARAFVAADEKCHNVQHLDVGDAVARDAAMHDLRLMFRYDCGCDVGTCPGLLLAAMS